MDVSAPANITVQLLVASRVGVADIVVTFTGPPHECVWIIELGLGRDPARKLPQAREYARAYAAESAAGTEVWACAVMVAATPSASRVPAAGGGEAVRIAWDAVTGGAA